MNSAQLFLNGTEVDLSDDHPITITYQINNLGDVQSQQGSGSNQVKLPLTQRNRIILGFPDDSAGALSQVYNKYTARYVEDGIEVIGNGYAILDTVEDRFASIQVLTGNLDFFDQLGGQLYDMGDTTTPWGSLAAKTYVPQSATSETGPPSAWTTYDHNWNIENIVNSQTKKEGWIWPIIDYGDGNFDTNQAQLVMNTQYMRPGFFLKTAIDLLVQSTSYQIDKVNSCLYSNPLFSRLYDNLIVQFANGSFDHGTTYQNTPDNLSMTVATSANANIRQQDSQAWVHFDTIISDPTNHHDTGSHGYKATERVEVDVEFTFGCRLNGTMDKDKPTILYFEIFYGDSNGEVQQATQALNFTAPVLVHSNNFIYYYQQDFYNQTLACSLELVKDSYVKVYYRFDNGRDSKTSGIVFAGATLKVTTKHDKVLYGQPVQCERILPSISQTDLLKDTLQRFGLICQTDNNLGTVTFASLKDIIAHIPDAVDWTDKLTRAGRTSTLKLGNYAQLNTMEFPDDDNITQVNGLKYGWDAIRIPNNTLANTGTLVQSKFGPSLNTDTPIGSTAQLKTYKATSFSVGGSPRLLVNNLVTIPKDKSVLFTDNSDKKPNQSTYDPITLNAGQQVSMPYFYKPDGKQSLLWCDAGKQPGLKSLYYPEMERLLQRQRKELMYFMLTPTDILQLNLLRPIYLGRPFNAYFYIAKIEDWQKHKATRVELVMLG